MIGLRALAHEDPPPPVCRRHVRPPQWTHLAALEIGVDKGHRIRSDQRQFSDQVTRTVKRLPLSTLLGIASTQFVRTDSKGSTHLRSLTRFQLQSILVLLASVMCPQHVREQRSRGVTPFR